MVKLRKLRIEGFRGATNALPLDFTSGYQSVAVLGENAGGKSTITDALEWYFTNRVDHLWREDCKEEALRNVQIGDTQNSVVAIDFSEPDLSDVKELSPEYRIDRTNKTAGLVQYLQDSASEQLWLRSSDLTNFIIKTKNDKRGYIADIIGYDQILNFRNVIQSTLNSLQREDSYVAAKQNFDTSQARSLKISGTIISTELQLYNKVIELIKPYKISISITDDSSFEDCIDILKGQATDTQKTEKRIKFEEMKKVFDQLSDGLSSLQKQKKVFLPRYNKLVQNKEKIKELNLEAFLQQGKEIVEAGVPEPGKCPFCKSSVNIEAVKAEVEVRLEALAENRKDYDETVDVKNAYVTALRNVVHISADGTTKWKECELPETFSTELQAFSTATDEISETVSEKFSSYEELGKLDSEDQRNSTFLAAVQIKQDEIAALARALELTKDEEAVIEVITRLLELRKVFFDFHESAQVKLGYETQIESLSRIFDEFKKVQTAALQTALDLMSEDISQYYTFLHPEENVGNVQLRILGEEGVELEYEFHGEVTYPPIKYLSESHLNSLGLALFLSSVKLFNHRNKFFVLDDVVTSFDISHRRRLIRLLKEEFNDWQVILLTHDEFFFEIIKRELRPVGWITTEIGWDTENGIRFKPIPGDQLELIAMKRKNGFQVANDVRTLMEMRLKEIVCSLGVKVSFQYNGTNERRMPGELLSELRAYLNRKSQEVKSHPVFTKLEGSNVVGIAGSHDSSDQISSGDIDVVLGDLSELDQLFRCDSCKKLVGKEHVVVGKDKITCKCGKKELTWRL